MSDSRLRARVLLEEAHALGIDLADLIAADTTSVARIPTLADYLESVAPTFTARTAATYRPHWRLAVARLGDRRPAEVTVEDLMLVVADAETRARSLRQPAPAGPPARPASPPSGPSLLGRPPPG